MPQTCRSVQAAVGGKDQLLRADFCWFSGASVAAAAVTGGRNKKNRDASKWNYKRTSHVPGALFLQEPPHSWRVIKISLHPPNSPPLSPLSSTQSAGLRFGPAWRRHRTRLFGELPGRRRCAQEEGPKLNWNTSIKRQESAACSCLHLSNNNNEEQKLGAVISDPRLYLRDLPAAFIISVND